MNPNVNVNVNVLVPVRDLSAGWGGRLTFTFTPTFSFARADVIARVLEQAVGSWLTGWRVLFRCRPSLLSGQPVFLLESASPGYRGGALASADSGRLGT